MKKDNKIILIVLISLLVLILLLVFIFVKFVFRDKGELEKIYYYTYEDKFVMSSNADKKTNLDDLNNDYFIKEKVKNAKSNSNIIEVTYNEYGEEPITYGYYTEQDFNNYFKSYIDDGLICDNNSSFNMGEGVVLKCLIHESGFTYQKVDSELCVNIDDKMVCIKPNDWENIVNYKNKFESAGWICEYNNYTTGEWNDSNIPEDGILECSKDKPSTRHNDYVEGLFCFIGTDGGAICSNNNGWCGIGDDLNTWCFGNN